MLVYKSVAIIAIIFIFIIILTCHNSEKCTDEKIELMIFGFTAGITANLIGNALILYLKERQEKLLK